MIRSKYMSINVAVIGCGYWGPNLVRNFNRAKGSNVSYVCDLDQSRLNYIKKLYPLVKIIKDYKKILKDKTIEVVVIATPVKTHFKIAKDALLCQKHVWIEKPMTINSKQAKELIQIAKKNKRILIVDSTFIYTGAVRKIKELIQKKVLGKPYYYDSERVNLGLIRPDVNVIWDLAPHDISIIDYIFKQKPVSVCAIGSGHVFKGKYELAHLTLKHNGGLISHVHVSWLSPLKIRKIMIAGKKKMLVYDDIEPVKKIKVYNKGVKVRARHPLYRDGQVSVPKLDQTEALKKECQHFLDCIKNKKRPLSDGESGLRVVQVLEAANKSLKKGGKETLIEY